VCPHCGQEAPFDRFEDLELGRTYAADYTGTAHADMRWFKLKSSGRRVFAKVTRAELGGAGDLHASGHWLELVSFDGGFPNFRYRRNEGSTKRRHRT